MDPTETLATWLHNGHHATTARHSATNYNEWIARGGFPVRVQIHPAHDAYVRGDRYGAVVKLGHKYATVKMDRSGRTRRFSRDNVMEAAS